MSYYALTFNTIVCKMPSSAADVSDTEAFAKVNTILQPGLEIAAVVAEGFGPAGEIAGAGIELIGGILDISEGIADLVTDIETTLRLEGGDPDNFYISWTPDLSHPQPAEDVNNNDGSVVFYPNSGVSPSHGQNMVNLAKDNYAPNMPLTICFANSGGAICFWDWDNYSGDDLLCAFPIDDAHCGNFQKTLYNAIQDCTYYIDWTLTKVDTTPAPPPPPPPTILPDVNPTAIVNNGAIQNLYRNSIGHIIDVSKNLSTGAENMLDLMTFGMNFSFTLPATLNTDKPVVVSGATAPLAKSDIFWLNDTNGMLHVFYIDVYDTISHIYNNQGTWIYQNLNDLVRTAPMHGMPVQQNQIGANSITGYKLAPIIIEQQIHLMYMDEHYNLSNLYSADGISWVYQNLTQEVSNGPGQPIVGLISSNPQPIIYNNEVHIFYWDSNLHLSDIYKSGDSWQCLDASVASKGNMEIKWDPYPVLFDGKIHVLCNVNTYIYDVIYDGSWTYNYVPGYSQLMNIGCPTAAVYKNQYLQVIYRDLEGNILDLSLDSADPKNEWQFTNLSSQNNAPYCAGSCEGGKKMGNDPSLNELEGAPFALVADNVFQVSYTDANNNISVISYDGNTWTYSTLPAQS